MKEKVHAHILFVDVEVALREILKRTFYSGCGFLGACYEFDCRKDTRKDVINITAVDYVVIQGNTICHINHLMMSFLPFLKNSKWILICPDGEDFFHLQTYDWFFAVRQKALDSDCEILIKKLRRIYQNEDCYYFKSSINATRLWISDIYYIECNKNYIYLYGKNFCWKDRATMKYAQNILGFYDFILINRGVMVNPRHIRLLQGNEIELNNQEKLYISRSRLGEVLQQLPQYLKKDKIYSHIK